jgi:hypothetical protein
MFGHASIIVQLDEKSFRIDISRNFAMVKFCYAYVVDVSGDAEVMRSIRM